jgi:hypothetical protein
MPSIVLANRGLEFFVIRTTAVVIYQPAQSELALLNVNEEFEQRVSDAPWSLKIKPTGGTNPRPKV